MACLAGKAISAESGLNSLYKNEIQDHKSGTDMTQTEQFNLHWLAKAMTGSPKEAKHYYYDSKSNHFLYSKTAAGYDGAMELYTPTDLAIKGDSYYEIFIRMAAPHVATVKIIEIFKLSTMQKRDIQWRFLNKFGGHKYHFSYFIAVIDQTDGDCFVLDKMISSDVDDSLFLLWGAFKLEAIRLYVTNFAKIAGVDINLSA